jgi:hypothetical protein
LLQTGLKQVILASNCFDESKEKEKKVLKPVFDEKL